MVQWSQGSVQASQTLTYYITPVLISAIYVSMFDMLLNGGDEEMHFSIHEGKRREHFFLQNRSLT